MRQRYAEETARKRKGIAGVFKGKQQALQEQAARMGVLGPGRAAGHVGKGMYDLSAEQAAQEINAQRESEAAMGAEMLGASKTERGYGAELERMGAGFGYQSKLLGQQISGTKELADAKNALDRELAANGWTAKAQMLKAQIDSAEGMQEAGFGEAATAREFGAEEARLKDERYAELMAEGWTAEAAMKQAEIDARAAMQDKEIGWGREQAYGQITGYDESGNPIYSGGGAMGLAEREMTLKEQALQQSGEQYTAQQGYFDPETGEYVQGTDAAQRFSEQRYERGTQELMNAYERSLEDLRFNYSNQMKAMTSLYDFMQLYVQGELSSSRFDEVNQTLADIGNLAGMDPPEYDAEGNHIEGTGWFTPFGTGGQQMYDREGEPI
jgi:hypothetical protein